MTEPTVRTPDTEPEDDTSAEVPDVREDEVDE